MIQRFILENIKEQLFKGKAIILMGSRQTGKTTLLRQLFGESEDVLWLWGDDVDTQAMLDGMTAARMYSLLGEKRFLVIDEAQRVKDIGLRMKVIADQMPDVQLIATGSSSFELANRLNEPLTGRKWEYRLYPLSFGEMVGHHGLLTERRLLPHRLVYGYYKKSDKLVALMQALSYQVGSQVSYSELANTVGIDVKTVESYIDVLEKSYIVFRLPSYSRNMRNELKNSKKIYFYDTGIRNALIANFSQIEMRTDAGALWENFIISERIKYNDYTNRWCNRFFWRTKEQKEIDYLEECDGVLSAFEFKFNPRKHVPAPKGFVENYKDASFKVITPENMEEFIMP